LLSKTKCTFSDRIEAAKQMLFRLNRITVYYLDFDRNYIVEFQQNIVSLWFRQSRHGFYNDALTRGFRSLFGIFLYSFSHIVLGTFAQNLQRGRKVYMDVVKPILVLRICIMQYTT